MIDAQIPLMVRPPEIDQPVNAMAKILQLKQVQQDGQLGAAKLAEHQRGLEETNRLNQIYSEAMSPDGTLDRQKIYSGAAAQQLGAKIPGLQKGFAESDKAEADAAKERIAGAMQKLTFGSQLLGSARDQASYDAARKTAQANGLDVSRMPAAYDPAFVQQKIQEGYTVAQQLEREMSLRKYTTPTANALLGAQTAQRAQDAAAAREQTQIVTDADGGVQLVSKQTGQAKPVTGADGKPVIGKGGMSAEQLKNASTKQQTVAILKKQIENLKTARVGLGSMDYGIVAGRQSMTDSARSYDGALSALQTTIRQLTRTPGEGAMSDYESRIAQSQLPGRVDPSSVIDQKISQLEDLMNVVETGYSTMLKGRPGQQPTSQQQGGVLSPQSGNSALLDQAKAAIAAGAPRDKVIERLKGMGIDSGGL